MAENQRILVCAGTGSASSGAHKLIDALKLELKKQGLEETVSIVGTGCQGFCEKGPTVIIEPKQVLYCSVQADDVAEIVAQDIMKGERVERLLLLDARDGYAGLQKALKELFLDFTTKDFCGKCNPCREGTVRMSEILDKIIKGEGNNEDIDILENLAYTIVNTSLCGLGQTAPDPILATIKHFKHEYEAHILEHMCPVHYSIDPEKCKGCGLCARNCPVLCITGEKKKPYVIKEDYCIKCSTCVDKCKFNAVIRA